MYAYKRMCMYPHWRPLRRLCPWSGYRVGSTCRNTVTLVTNAKELLPASGWSHRVTRRHVPENSNIFRLWELKISRQYWWQAFLASFS